MVATMPTIDDIVIAENPELAAMLGAKDQKPIARTEFNLDDLVAGPPPQTAEDETRPTGRWEPSVLRPRHREILRRVLEGATYLEIAEAMGIHHQTVMLVATSKLFREELAKLEASADFNVVQRAEAMSNEALDKIKTLMRTARSEFLQKSCAERILDTAGYSKVERKIVGIVNGEDVIKELNKRRREAAQMLKGEIE